jgi:hypothetical protein
VLAKTSVETLIPKDRPKLLTTGLVSGRSGSCWPTLMAPTDTSAFVYQRRLLGAPAGTFARRGIAAELAKTKPPRAAMNNTVIKRFLASRPSLSALGPRATPSQPFHKKLKRDRQAVGRNAMPGSL